MSCADTYPIQAQYVRYMHNTSSIRVLPSDAVDTARYTVDTQPIRSRYAADTQPIRRLYIVTCPLPHAEGAAPPAPYKAALAIQQRQEEEEEEGGRGKRARKPKPQAEEPAKSSKKGKGSPKKGKKGK